MYNETLANNKKLYLTLYINLIFIWKIPGLQLSFKVLCNIWRNDDLIYFIRVVIIIGECSILIFLFFVMDEKCIIPIQ